MDIQRPDLRRQHVRKRWKLGALIIAVLTVAGFGILSLEPAAPTVERNTVWTGTVKRGVMVREVRGQGILVPKVVRWIAAETDARVERVLIRPGAIVDADTVILELSNPVVKDELARAQAQFSSAKAKYEARRSELESQILDQRAELASMEAEYESARLQAEAEKELADQGIIPAIQYRRTQLKVGSLNTRITFQKERIAKARQNMRKQLESDEAEVEQLARTRDLRQRQAEALEVRAGIEGVLQQVVVEAGQRITAGSNLARVAQSDVLIAQLRIAESQAKDVAIGKPTKVDTRNGIVLGKVARVDPAVRNGTVQVDVELQGALPPGARPDLSVTGTIEIERLENVLYVGRPAFGQPETQTTLFRIIGDGTAMRVPVKLGRASVDTIEIEKGLAEGDQVILSDTSAWDSNDRIRLN